jgi:TonB family protein
MLGSDPGHFVFAAGCNRTTMLLVRRRYVSLQVAPIAALIVLPLLLFSQTPDLEQHLRDEYQDKTFLLRGFYSGDKLHFSASGDLTEAATPGDWTEDGFITIDEVHLSHHLIKLKARRLLVIMQDREFHFRPAERKKLVEPKGQPVMVSVELDMAADHPAANLVDGALSRIFLTGQDQLAILVPECWRFCVSQGLTGKNSNCRFSSEVSAVPGVASLENASDSTSPLSPPSMGSSGARMNSGVPSHGVFRPGGGVKPPRLLNSPPPEFSDSARAVKYEGVMTLGLIVERDGHPSNIHVLSPLGSGLDVKAVQAVQDWRFQPAEKDGQPVRVEIAVEVNFHLY